ncbi:MAG: hypothetical protein HZB72_03830 [Burkholderiales bacterium]|nr:hypothetical protein [Burkholderiales bacterium]
MQRLAWPRRAATLVGALLLGLAGLLGLTWLVVDAAIVPRIDQWRPEVERHATRALGVKLRIGRLSAERSGVLPRLSLHDVRLLDEQGRAALVLGRIDARLSPLALLQALLWQELPAARLDLQTPELQVRRDRSGTWWVGGLALRPRAGGDAGAALDWLFSQRAITLAGGRVVWTDEARGAAPLALQAVEIRLRNSGGVIGREHEMSLRATPPAGWDTVSLAGRFSQPRVAVWTPLRPGPQGQRAGVGRTRAGDLRTWSGEATLALPQADVALLRRHLPLPAALERAVRGARGALSADLRWRRGELAGVAADLGLRDVDLRLGESLAPLRLAHLAGRLELAADEDGGRLSARGLTFALLDDAAPGAVSGTSSTSAPRAPGAAGVSGAPAAASQAAASTVTHATAAASPMPAAPPRAAPPTARIWPASRFDLSWRAPAQPPAPGSAASWAPGLRWDAARGGSLKADRLDLGLLAALAQRLPLPAAVQAHLGSLAPRGIAQDLDLSWDGPLDAPRRYTARGRVSALAVQAREARQTPGGDGGALGGAAAGGAPAPGASPQATPNRASASAPLVSSAPAPAHPVPGRPGVEGASVRFEATEKGGQAELAIQQGALTFPGVFEEPRIPLRELSARLSWTVQQRAGQPPAVELRARQVRLANDDLQGELQATWRTGDPARRQHGRGAWLPGHLDLDGRLPQARATAVARYLPQTLAADARHYVRDAVQAGELADVRFAVHGDLWDVPFPHGGGQFLIRGQVRGATLAYVPGTTGSGTPADPAGVAHAATHSAAPPAVSALGWPVFTDLHGELVFEQQSMSIRGARARLGTVGAGRFELTGVEGRIADLAHGTLAIEGRGRGPLDDLLQYLRTTPLGDWTGQALGEARGSGPADLTLSLKLPLAHIAQSSVRGSVRLAGNELQILPGMPALTGLRGDIGFTERGVQVRAGARALGGELRIDGGSQVDGSLRFSAQGDLTADGLRRALVDLGGSGGAGTGGSAGAAPAAARLAGRLSGQTSARLQLGFVGGQAQWQLSSNLVGLGIDLPAPLGKKPEQALPLKAQLAPLAGQASAAASSGDAPQAARDGLRIELGTLLQAHYQLRAPGSSQRVVRGAIGLLQPARLPASGVEAAASLPRLDVAAWRALWQAPAGARGAPAVAAVARSVGGSPGAFIGPAPGDSRLRRQAGEGLPLPGALSGTLPAAAPPAPASALPPAHLPASLPPPQPASAAGLPAAASAAAPTQAAAQGMRPPAAQGGGGQRPGASAAPLGASLAAFLPERIELRTPVLDLGTRSLQDVTLLLGRAPAEAGWRAQITSDQVEGTVDVADDGSRISARLSRLTIPAGEAGSLHAGGAPGDDDLLPDDPASVPALDIVAEQFDWRGLRLGRLEVQAENVREAARDAPAARLWRLNRLELTNPHARLSATGSWLPAAARAAGGSGVAGGSAAAGAARRHTQLDFTLDLADSGALLARLGWPQTVRGGKGRIVGRIGWPGSPLAAGTQGLDGELRIDLQSGQFLKAEPGAARLLGVLSLQSLPRRLLLDFRDVFQQGFAFDRIDGDVKLDDGVARTRNLRMKGLQAVVLMEGSADLNRETQALNVWVVPEINAGAASLAYAAVNPAIGLGTFVAQYLLRKPLMEAGTREFRVTGSWAEPQVERVARGQLQPAAAEAGDGKAERDTAAAQAAAAASAPR